MGDDQPFVTVAVPTWNRRQTLKVCISSLLDQDYPADRFEVVVVDDGSTDGTGDAVRGAGTRVVRPVLRYVRQEHRGLNAARNTAMRHAVGGLVCFVDDDVQVPERWLSNMVSGWHRHPDAKCIGGPIRLRIEGRSPAVCGQQHLAEPELDLGQEERVVPHVIGANFAVTSDAFGLAGEFDERLTYWYDEIEWMDRLRQAGGAVVYIPDAWLWHRRTGRELRLGNRLRKKFRQGEGEARFRMVSGRKIQLAREIAYLPVFLAHAAIRRCTWGVLSVSMVAGHVWGVLRYRSPWMGEERSSYRDPGASGHRGK